MYVLDTNVLSLTAPTKTRPDEEVVGWLDRNSNSCFICTITLAELSFGAAWLARRGATRRSAALQRWISHVRVAHRSRLLPIDDEIAVAAGRLLAAARAVGTEVDIEDALIAACAEQHGMVVLTDNERHFRPMGVSFFNPFNVLPPDTRT